MEVILREDIEKLGTRGQVVKVASGYARNYLLPKRLAVTATESNKKIVEQERQAHLRKEAKLAEDARQLGNLMASVVVTITQKAGEEGQLFGSVTAADIAEALAAQNYTIERRKIQLEHPIKQVGEYKVPVRLHKEVAIEIPVNVVAQAAE
jgi:large subunit ribosomal protein L9